MKQFQKVKKNGLRNMFAVVCAAARWTLAACDSTGGGGGGGRLRFFRRDAERLSFPV
jgi:hypothetical protein